MATIEESIRSESKAEGRAEGITLGSRKTYVTTCKEFGLDQKSSVTRFASKFNVSLEEAKEAVKQYWK